ncbi:hypothetical protein K474DRAFT_1771977 [Panus rudis PR-1116 ss-1]|nr:hypothetical protein K474DRAFT_1771977 [Panus rudis PR-1116 ss-1]
MLSSCFRRSLWRTQASLFCWIAHDGYHCRRQISTSSLQLDSSLHGLVNKLADSQPCFAMKSGNVQILREPTKFYETLLEMIRRAKKRIFISSLYIGSEEDELINTLMHALKANPSLQVRMHLDLNRSTRPGAKSTAQLVLPLLETYPDRVHIALFRSPKLKGVMAKIVPPRFNEGWGTWHPKIYGADDDVLISGANLNESYFTNRQDRYVLLRSQPAVAQYCFAFLQASSGFSYKLLASSDTPQGYQLIWPDRNVHPQHIEDKAECAWKTFQDTYRLSSTFRIPSSTTDAIDQATDADHDVLVFPIIQAGQFNIREEEHALGLLFGEISNVAMHAHNGQSKIYGGPVVDLTSGYFGIYRPYRDFILTSVAATRIIAAAPKANGFYGSSGLSGRLPEGYTLLEQRFMSAVQRAGREWADSPTKDTHDVGGIQLREWARDGWTYHAKGIWLRPTPSADPYLTVFGSTNLNSRSANLDTELSFVLVTSSPTLRRQLAEEVEGLRMHTQPWRGGERKVRIGTKALVAVMGGML